MPELDARLTFNGPTALSRAFHLAETAGYPCAVVPAPDGASPCGLALALRARDLEALTAVLTALGVRPRGSIPTPLTAGGPS